MPFQDILGFDLHIDAKVVTDPWERPSSMVIGGKPWGVIVDWSVGGRYACYLGGTWIVQAFVDAVSEVRREQIGSAVNIPVGSAPPFATPRRYQATVHCLITTRPSIYRVMAVVTLENEGVAVPFAGFAEVGIVQVCAAK